MRFDFREIMRFSQKLLLTFREIHHIYRYFVVKDARAIVGCQKIVILIVLFELPWKHININKTKHKVL